jgi:MoaF N-terminal domain
MWPERKPFPGGINVGAAPVKPEVLHEIGGPSTKELAGTKLLYEYSTGRKYQLSFDPDNVTFLFVKDPAAKPVSLPYRARKIRENLFLVHWLNREGHIHVALLLDLERRQVHVSALMPGGIEFFDIAEIEKGERPTGR